MQEMNITKTSKGENNSRFYEVRFTLTRGESAAISAITTSMLVTSCALSILTWIAIARNKSFHSTGYLMVVTLGVSEFVHNLLEIHRHAIISVW